MKCIVIILLFICLNGYGQSLNLKDKNKDIVIYKVDDDSFNGIIYFGLNIKRSTIYINPDITQATFLNFINVSGVNSLILISEPRKLLNWLKVESIIFFHPLLVSVVER